MKIWQDVLRFFVPASIFDLFIWSVASARTRTKVVNLIQLKSFATGRVVCMNQ